MEKEAGKEFSLGEKIMLQLIADLIGELTEIELQSIWETGLRGDEERATFAKAAELCGATEKFLKILLEQKAAGNARYSEENKMYAQYMALTAGPKAYEVLASNAPMPSLSSIKTYVTKSPILMCEGSVRARELQQFLDERHYPRKVALSEDATSCLSKVLYICF